MGTYSLGSNPAEQFTEAKAGTVQNKVFKNHMTTDESFVVTTKGLEKVITNDKYAYYDGANFILAIPGYDCKVFAFVYVIRF